MEWGPKLCIHVLIMHYCTKIDAKLSWTSEYCRYGLVGRNGLGKSTLMNAVAKRELAVPPAVSLLHVAQEVEGTSLLEIDSFEFLLTFQIVKSAD